MNILKIMIGSGFVMVLLFMSGCSSESSGESEEVVNLTFWDFHSDNDQEFFEGLVDEYNDMQDDVKIEYSTTNNLTDYSNTKLPVAFANNEGPDIFMTSPGDFQKYADAGVMADLTPYFEDGIKEDFLPSALEAVTVDDKILALPFELELLGLYYNKTMLDEANVEVPETWDELLEAAKKLTTDEVSGIALPTDKGSYLNFVWYPFLWQNGGSVLSEDGKESTFNTPEVAEALEMWGSFFQEGAAPSKLQIDPTDIGNLGSGSAAMQIVGTWAIPMLENEYGDGDEYGLTPIPIPAGGESATAAGGWKLAVNSNSEHIEEAAEFVMWALADDKERPLEYVTETKFAYSPRESVVEEGEEIYDKGLREVFTEEIYDSAIPEPEFGPEIVDAVGEALQNVMFSGMSGEEAAEIAHEKIQAVLDSK
ncbi:multiple sugar transport system substrate-binding protein [Lentibacillus halodurans]|uniref:Multiple sugar transport system substrate-binding protein n=1 Tax=Lentibacillus halodurans TaxID=237679 RepID=A0A1I0YHF5_9BACI|nr:sugar ABC transporter substrate-binding protein [Lentibacillus halodurans]SFB11798.1 multiple sugar transport system substrate-binding protein [Lentibacillus halodurans]